jgi:hypothetical protein
MHIVLCFCFVFLLFFVLCTLCCLFVSIVFFWFPLQYSLTFIFIENYSPWASIAPRAPPPSMLTYVFKSSYISSWRKNMLTLKVLGGTCRLRLIFTTCRLFLRTFWFFSIFVFASIKCILNSLESISIWYQMKAYCITFQLNTRYSLWLSNFVRREKPTPPSSWNETKDVVSLKSVDKKIFRTKLRSFFYTKPNKYITFNKSCTNNPLWSDFWGQNTWKMGYFQFCRFSQDSAYILILLIK